MPQKKGFTLVELLVVIAIIGLIAAISVLALANTRVKSRDSRRVADIKQISTALEVFYSEQDRYPTAEEWVEGQPLKVGNITYLGRIPSAPDVADGDCTADNNKFTYSVSTDGDSYTLGYCLGAKTGSVATGVKCSGPTGSVNGACDGTGMISAASYDLTTVSGRNAKRLADIAQIKSALSAMYTAKGYYFLDNEYSYYGGRFFISGLGVAQGNCLETVNPNNHPDWGNNYSCPELSNACIKADSSASTFDTDCDSGDVYLRNIPLNNYLPTGGDNPIDGAKHYKFLTANNVWGSDDYAMVRYKLEGSSTVYSDHFLNGVPTTCNHGNDIYDGSFLCGDAMNQ